mmetsp:Transcript_40163/g.99267  ORF Transcript_40163/g.99267 Transcript_40163/m.99267 type:complete len:202 (+) Transcript_40163:1100-1705(+)
MDCRARRVSSNRSSCFENPSNSICQSPSSGGGFSLACACVCFWESALAAKFGRVVPTASAPAITAELRLRSKAPALKSSFCKRMLSTFIASSNSISGRRAADGSLSLDSPAGCMHDATRATIFRRSSTLIKKPPCPIPRIMRHSTPSVCARLEVAYSSRAAAGTMASLSETMMATLPPRSVITSKSSNHKLDRYQCMCRCR